MATKPARKRRTRSDGERSYRAIVDAAARLATLEGLEGISIGRVAGEIGMSKSGLFSHFASKQDLQLAAIGAAEAVYAAEVIEPAMQLSEGLERLELLCERYLSYIERGVFPGGCFFASTAAEWDTRRGPVRDRVRAVLAGWTELLETNLRTAQQQETVDRGVDAGQLTFEINALLHEANGHYLLFRDPAALDRARQAISDRLERAKSVSTPELRGCEKTHRPQGSGERADERPSSTKRF
jgi:AcrR family transcriptional regulator